MNLKQQLLNFGGVYAKMASWVDNSDGILGDEMGVVLAATKEFADKAVQSLKSGKVIAVPTDTLYGFACDAWYALKLLFSISMFILFTCLLILQMFRV